MLFIMRFIRIVRINSRDGLPCPYWYKRRRIRSHDGLRDLYTRWHLPLLKFVQRRIGNLAEAEDLTQESFARFLAAQKSTQAQNQDQAQNQTSALLWPEHRRSYLYRIAINLLRDRRRRLGVQHGAGLAAPETFTDHDQSMDVPCGAPTPLDLVVQRQRVARLEQALAELPERQREALVLHRFDGLTQDEVARRMNISRRMVVKHLARALAHCALRDKEVDPDHGEGHAS